MSDKQNLPAHEGNDLPSVSIRRPVLIVVLNILIARAGIAALMGVEVRELPDVDQPVVTVRATFPVALPRLSTPATSISRCRRFWCN